jgi:hypothetical protein
MRGANHSGTEQRPQSESQGLSAGHLVTFARGVLQQSPFQHANSSIPARDQPGVLQCPHDERDRGTVHSEHDGEKFLFQQKLSGADAILDLESATSILRAI